MPGADTTVGGIVGFVRMDADQFNREADLVLAKVEAIEHSDPTVRVKADTGGAETKMTAFGAAASRSLGDVEAASRRVDDATGRVRVAEERLSEARSAALPRASKIVSAEEDLRKARRAEQDAIYATYAGNIKLDDSMQKLEKSTRRASQTGRQFGQSFAGIPTPAIVGGLVAGLALVGPLAGAGTAAVGGMVGVLGAAALAAHGLQMEMQSGSKEGEALAGTVGALKGDFRDLSREAADGAKDGVLAALQQVHGTLPFLRDEVHGLGKDLGNAFHTTTGGLLSGLRQMRPLLQDGGYYANVLADKFSNFMESQDFTDFVDYSRRELPEVANALESVASATVDVSKALAPVGDGLVKGTNGLGRLGSAWSKTMKYTTGIGVLSEGLKLLGSDSKDAAAGANEHADATERQQASLAAANPALAAQATTLGTTVSALQAASQAQDKAADATKAATLQMQLENDAAGLLKQSLDELNGKALTAAEAQNAFDSSLVNMGDHVTASGKKVKFTTTSIKDMSSASVELRGQLNAQVENLQKVVEANGGLDESTGKARGQMVKMRKQIIDNAVAHGVDRKAVTAYVDSLLKIPKKVPPTRLEVEKKQAEDKVRAFKRLLDSLHSVHINIDAAVLAGTQNKLSHIKQANGSVLHSYAGGGFENHVAQIAPPGAARLWNEPETMGESYIPLAPSKRTRSLAIWEETGRLLGAPTGGRGVHIDHLEVKAVGQQFSLRQVLTDVALQSA